MKSNYKVTVNHLVRGSSPRWGANKNRDLGDSLKSLFRICILWCILLCPCKGCFPHKKNRLIPGAVILPISIKKPDSPQ